MSEDKLSIIREYRLNKEKIETLEKEYESLEKFVDESKTDRLLSLLLKIEITLMKDSLAKNIQSEIEMDEHLNQFQNSAQDLMKTLGDKFGFKK